MVMFGGAFSEFKPEEESLQVIITALQQVITIITKAIEQGLIAEKDPLLVVNLVWASLHGTIHLHLGGHIQNEAAAKILYDRSVSNLIHTFFRNDTEPLTSSLRKKTQSCWFQLCVFCYRVIFFSTFRASFNAP